MENNKNGNEMKQKRHDIRYNYFSVFIYPSILFGLILIFFGDDILLYTSNFELFQGVGLIFITLGLTAYAFIKARDEREKRTDVKWYYRILTSLLFVVIILLFLLIYDFLIPFNSVVFLIMSLVYYTIFSDLITRAVNNLLNTVKGIDDKGEKITVIIGFFGVLISILTLIN